MINTCNTNKYMYLPEELWKIVREFMLEPKWKTIGKKTFVKQIDIISKKRMCDYGYNFSYHSSEIMLFNQWNFKKNIIIGKTINK